MRRRSPCRAKRAVPRGRHAQRQHHERDHHDGQAQRWWDARSARTPSVAICPVRSPRGRSCRGLDVIRRESKPHCPLSSTGLWVAATRHNCHHHPHPRQHNGRKTPLTRRLRCVCVARIYAVHLASRRHFATMSTEHEQYEAFVSLQFMPFALIVEIESAGGHVCPVRVCGPARTARDFPLADRFRGFRLRS